VKALIRDQDHPGPPRREGVQDVSGEQDELPGADRHAAHVGAVKCMERRAAEVERSPSLKTEDEPFRLLMGVERQVRCVRREAEFGYAVVGILAEFVRRQPRRSRNTLGAFEWRLWPNRVFQLDSVHESPKRGAFDPAGQLTNEASPAVGAPVLAVLSEHADCAADGLEELAQAVLVVPAQGRGVQFQEPAIVPERAQGIHGRRLHG